MTSVERCGPILSSGAAEQARARAATGANVDVEALVATYSPVMYRVAFAVVRNAAEAEDAVQSAFVRVLAHRAKLPEVGDMRVWLVRVVWRLALDSRSRAKPEQMDDAFARSLVATHLPADQALAEARELRLALAEIERLPRTERHVLLLAAIEEMKTAEIADVLGKSESAVRALLFRARTRLRERLQGRLER